MLKAYDYVEYSPDSGTLQDAGYFKRELEIARGIVEKIHNNPGNKKHIKGIPSCPACGGEKLSVFCKKWDVTYLRCESCESVFADVTLGELEEYGEEDALKKFRASGQYQEEASQPREATWEESIGWMEFRAFRYLGRNKGLKVLDIGNRYRSYSEKIAASGMASGYTLVDSILGGEKLSAGNAGGADIVLYLNQVQQSQDPRGRLKEISASMKKGALLFFSTRTGTGFDVLTLKGHSKIFPYEHIFLPSKAGMEIILGEAGFRILEYSTPGRMDVGAVLSQEGHIGDSNYFIKSLIKNGDRTSLAEFQRFLQKSGMSSYAQVIAVKEM